MKRKVKLTKGEIVLPPSVAANPRNRAILEAMNAEGLMARNAGGVVAYRAQGGMVGYLNQGGMMPQYHNEGDVVAATPGAEVPEEVKEGGFKEWASNNKQGIGNVGAALVAIGQNDFTGASDALRISDKDAKDKKLTDAEKKANSDKEVSELAREALTLTGAASVAGDLINGFVKLDADEEKSLDEKFGDLIGATVNVAAGAFDATRRVRDEARRRIVSANEPESYKAFVRLTLLANQMVLPVLASGALGVNPTDADVELAKQSQFDIAQPSSTWNSQLNDLIVRNGGVAETVAEISVAKGTETIVDGVNNGTVEVKVPVIETTTVQPGDDGDAGDETVVIEDEEVVPGSTPETAIVLSERPLSKKDVLGLLKKYDDDIYITVTIDGWFENKLVTDTVINVREYLEE